MIAALLLRLKPLPIVLLVGAPVAAAYLIYSFFSTTEPIDVVLLKEGTQATLEIVSLEEYVKKSDPEVLREHAAGGKSACRIFVSGGGRIYIEGGKAWFEEGGIANEIAWQLSQCLKSSSGTN